jgi:NADPH:quinone reductase-like Zn-dependent oxidoreductase
MLALRYHSFGDLDGLGLEDIPMPVPAAGEVLVRIRAASLNPVDWKIASGSFRLIVRGGVPRTMGSDFAGEVTAVGSGVTTVVPGDRVFGFIDPFARTGGTFAEFASIPQAFVHRMPPELGYEDAAALACVGATAVTLCNLGCVGAGSNVLVNGASGGVGHVTVQVASARGAIVSATASAARHEFIRSLGARSCIDYRTEPMQRWPGGFDAVLDCVPNIPRGLHPRLLVRRGHYVTTVPGAATLILDPLMNRFGAVRRHGVMLKPDAAAISEVLRYVAQGRLHCAIESALPLRQARDAIERSRSGRVQGKIVLVV